MQKQNESRTKLIDVYGPTGVYMGQRRVLIGANDRCSVFDYEKYENDSAYGYDHSAFAPDLGDKC